MLRNVVAVSIALFALAGCSSADQGEATGTDEASVSDNSLSKASKAELNQARQATAKYHDESLAIADGFWRDDACDPGMGIHYANFDRFGAPLTAAAPAVLLCEPSACGS